MIWKESLLDEDNFNMHSGCYVRLDQAFSQQLPQHGPILVSSRPPAIAHLCHDARAAALKHHKRDDSPTLREGLNNSPWLSKPALLVPRSYNKIGYGVLAEELQREPFKSHSVLLDASMVLDAPTHLSMSYGMDSRSNWWQYRFHQILQNHCQTSAYDFLRNARDDQVMVTIPQLVVSADFTPSHWSRCKFLACQVPGCNDDQIFEVLLNPELEWDETFTYRDVYVDVQDHDALWCILRAARNFFLVAYPAYPPQEVHGSLDDKAFIQKMAQNALKSLQDLWVRKSRELSGEEKVMPRIRPVIKIRITIEHHSWDL